MDVTKTDILRLSRQIKEGIAETQREITTAANGWILADETWAYSSVDNPTGVITVLGDVTGKYSLGMKIKFTNNSNVVYGKISKTPTYSRPNTTITFLHEINPVNSQALHLMANSAITNNYYSTVHSPQGFPINPNKWTVKIVSYSTFSQDNPTKSVWYNATSIAIPIGIFTVGYSALGVTGEFNNTTTEDQLWVALSTTNNGATDAELIALCRTTMNGTTPIGLQNFVLQQQSKTLELTEKTTCYLNYKTEATGLDLMGLYGDTIPIVIKAVFAV